MMRLRAILISALLCLAACGGEANPPPGRVTDLLPRIQAADAESETSVALDLWLEGAARLALAARGNGEAEVTLEEDGGEPVRLGRVVAGGDVAVFPLPAGPGAVRVRLPLEGVEWALARLEEPSRQPTAAPSDGTALRGRSVLVILCDSLAAAHLSSHGNPRATSPNIDALAARGVRFEAAYSQTAWTLPSVASLFTSEEQERHGVTKTGLQLGSELTTLAELFRDAGYRTVGWIRNGTVGPHSGLGRGFDVYQRSRQMPLDRLGAEVLGELGGDGPVFLYLHMLAPHMPYLESAERRFDFDPTYTGDVTGSIQSCGAISASGLPADHPDVRHLAARYDEYLRSLDEWLGALFQAIERDEHGEDLLIVFTSDHGEAFQQHGRSGHGPLVFDEMVRVPLVFAATGASWSRGATVASPASLLDVMPTLIELLGLGEPAQRPRGRSLVPELIGAGVDGGRPIFLTARYHDGVPEQSGVRAGRFKWILDGESGAERLFDLVEDPGEQIDLAARRPIPASALRRLHGRWRSDAESDRVQRTDARSVELDDALQRELEALGYAGDEDE